MKWVIVVPQGQFTRCYGLFTSYDLAMVWVRENQFEPEDVQVYLVIHDEVVPPSAEERTNV